MNENYEFSEVAATDCVTKGDIIDCSQDFQDISNTHMSTSSYPPFQHMKLLRRRSRPKVIQVVKPQRGGKIEEEIEEELSDITSWVSSDSSTHSSVGELPHDTFLDQKQ